MTVVTFNDGQAYHTDADYSTVRQVIWENKNTGLPAGWTSGGGQNPPAWFEATWSNGTRKSFARSAVVSVEP